MNIKMKLAGLFLGALIATTSSFAAETTHKCGAEMKKEMKGSCGAGKCGASMKSEMNQDMKDVKQNMMQDMKDTKKEIKDEMKGSCGAGKCGSK
jgi:uncharacterized low-complexity protein